ncbi:pimeloyl-ACP methyl ester carboxylesterase [Pseudomonas sp. BIGb0408]|uniref:Pimeloyl-ACP methyl ester carboxylesterase n=1 Tax=Phytopseudomonas flavescens TaxID=29435 RepID=A0A7Y9XJM9_9GAMM|nr:MULTISPECIES: alpha/beta fold hydrolase [Pseudomonas]MCW2292880.1 pimeloyl-ACP methyl ester carboxylesterase [Pseudomonas sp. BIGb0408]NYH72550.1 pimeloyl-ACP methyl ester carboxylesterase [Pseudomonas flavescens]
MQSSSELFPVALISADLRGDLSEDVYRLKPGNSPDFSVELVLTRLAVAGQEGARGEPVILLHGSFSNRRFWYSPKCIGLAPYLARAGFDVWIAEMRGHGLSPRNLAYRHNCVADYARYDLPAIAAFVAEKNPRPAHWLGHSQGGLTLAAALGGGYLQQGGIASVGLFGTEISRRYWPLKVPPIEWLARLLLKRFALLSGSRLKRGPEDEPIGIALEILRWHRLFGRFGDAERDWWAGLHEVQVPLLAVAGEGDLKCPPAACRALFEQFASRDRQFIHLSRAQGFQQDYDHVQMLVSKPAQDEVWPLVRRWLEGERQAPLATAPEESAAAIPATP